MVSVLWVERSEPHQIASLNLIHNFYYLPSQPLLDIAVFDGVDWFLVALPILHSLLLGYWFWHAIAMLCYVKLVLLEAWLHFCGISCASVFVLWFGFDFFNLVVVLCKPFTG